MSDSLETWVQFGWLKRHQTSRAEISDLLAVVERDLDACRTPGLHNDWRFNIAYNAALQIATAALASAGFKAERSNHHFRTIHTLPLTLQIDNDSVGTFDAFRKKRNISDYERADAVSDAEADEMLTLAETLRDRFENQHPQYKR